MHSRLGVGDDVPYTRISKYELDENEPPLYILLQYARVAGVHVEALIDDEIDLPEKLPGPVKQQEIMRAYPARSRSRKR
jgi:transcriptional regulator with XRE-family HTH domain